MNGQLRLVPVDKAAVAVELAGVLAPGLDTSGGLVSVEEMLAQAQCFEVIAENLRRVASYAVQVVEHDHGSEAFVIAAVGGAPGVNLVGSVLPGIERQAAAVGCKSVAIVTRRRGLVAKLKAGGYEFGGYIMRKKLCH